MYVKRVGKDVQPDFRMVQEVLEELNKKFDPDEEYHRDPKEDKELFEFHYKSDGIRRESWWISFKDTPVASGNGMPGEYLGCQEGDYIFLTEENRSTIFMMAVEATVEKINDFLNVVSKSNVSEFNKMQWKKKFR